MSLTFFKTRKDAQDFWGVGTILRRVYVPSQRGFIQARKSGYYYVTDTMMHGLKLRGAKKPYKNKFAAWDAAFNIKR